MRPVSGGVEDIAAREEIGSQTRAKRAVEVRFAERADSDVRRAPERTMSVSGGVEDIAAREEIGSQTRAKRAVEVRFRSERTAMSAEPRSDP
jgi:hypothetical protein